MALLDTGSPQTFIRRNVLDRMLLVRYILHTRWRAERFLLVRVSVLGRLVPRTASAVLGVLVPRTESAVLGGLPFTPLIIANFAHTGHI